MKIDTTAMHTETDLGLEKVYTVDGGILDEVEIYTELDEAIERAEAVFTSTAKREYVLAAVNVLEVKGMVVMEPGATYYASDGQTCRWSKVTPLRRPERIVRDRHQVNHYSWAVDAGERAYPIEERGYSPAPGERTIVRLIAREFGTQFIPEPEYFGVHSEEDVLATIAPKELYHQARRNYQSEMKSLEESYMGW